MSLLEKPCVITVSGIGNAGKSTALIRLINLFITDKQKSYKVFLYDFKKEVFGAAPITDELREHTEQRKIDGNFAVPSYLVFVELPCGRKIGINTQGDPGTQISKWLTVLQDAKCDVFITATRLSGGTFDKAKNFAKKNDGVFIPIQKYDNTYYTNITLSEFLFELIKF